MNAPNPYTLPEISFVAGATQELAFRTFFFLNKKPYELDGCSANFSVVSFINHNSAPIISKAMKIELSGDGDGGEAVENLLTVTLEAEDTAELAGKYIYQITVKDGGGKTDIPNQGIFYIYKNIDKGYIGR